MARFYVDYFDLGTDLLVAATTRAYLPRIGESVMFCHTPGSRTQRPGTYKVHAILYHEQLGEPDFDRPVHVTVQLLLE